MADCQTCISFMLTLQCPLKCAHCITDSRPDRHEVLDEAFLERTIKQAAESGAKYISFTGGDPFAFLHKLRFCSDVASSVGLQITVATSAFWAKTEAYAVEALTGLNLAMLGISCAAAWKIDPVAG